MRGALGPRTQVPVHARGDNAAVVQSARAVPRLADALGAAMMGDVRRLAAIWRGRARHVDAVEHRRAHVQQARAARRAARRRGGADAAPVLRAHAWRRALDEAGLDGVPAVRQAREQAHPSVRLPDRRAALALASHQHLERSDVDDPLHTVAAAGGGVLIGGALSLPGLDGDRVAPAVAQHGQDVRLRVVHGSSAAWLRLDHYHSSSSTTATSTHAAVSPEGEYPRRTGTKPSNLRSRCDAALAT